MTGSESAPDDDEVMTAAIYVPRRVWRELRALGLPEQASASAQTVELIIDYLQAGKHRQQEILRRAATRSRGKSSRARPGPDDVVSR